jgi:type IV pilus assembly protein PilQ
MAVLAMPAPLMLASARVEAQATIRADGVQLQVRRLPDAIELVIQDAGAGGALEQRRDGTVWTGELRTDRIRGLKSGPQSLAMPDAGMERITFDGTGRLFELKVTPVQGKNIPAPVVSSDGKNLVVRFEAPPLPVTQTARPNLSRPVPVPTPSFVPPLQPRASAPPVGDMAVGSMVIRNRAYVNLSGPPVTMTTRGANARDVLMVLAQMGGYGFAYSGPDNQEKKDSKNSGATGSSDTPYPISVPVVPVTISFRGEPFERAFNFVLLTSGLQARLEGRTVLVGSNILSKTIGPQLSKVYRLNQIAPNQAADYIANLGAQVTKTRTVALGFDIENSDDVSRKSIEDRSKKNQQFFEGRSTESLITSVESYGAAAGPLVGLQATTDTRLGTITLFGEASLISIAEQYLRQLDLRQRQVALAVKILDVNLSNSSEIDNSFALRFGTNFIVNDGGQLIAAFGQDLPARSGDFDGQVGPSINRVASTSTRTRGQSSTNTSESTQGQSSSNTQSGEAVETLNQNLVFQLANGRSLSQEQIERLNVELTNATGTEAKTLEDGETFVVTPVTSSSRQLTTSLARTIQEKIESSLKQSVDMSRVDTSSSTNAFEVLRRSSSGSTSGSESGKSSGSEKSSSYEAGTRRNPGKNYQDNQFYDFLRAQIISSNTKILASPTLILQEGDSLNGGSDSVRISSDGKVGRARTNEAFVRVGTQFVTSYAVKQDVVGNNFCEPVFGNAGLTLGARVDKIDDNGFVTFSLSPEISAAVGTQSAGNCGPINIINDRLLDTGRLRVRDGQTLILTGVISSTDQQVVSKWPILGDMPLIGQFFRRTSGSRSKNELVIMVTPRIIDDARGGVYGYGYEPSTRDARGMTYEASLQ